MKPSLTITIVFVFASLIFITACKTKKEVNDPTVLEVHVLAELKKGVPGNRIQKELTQFNIIKIKPSNKTLNEFIYTVILKGQSADELLRAFNTKDYIKSAIIAPMGGAPAENMPSGKSTKTKPIKG